jgi:hypothetical protein
MPRNIHVQAHLLAFNAGIIHDRVLCSGKVCMGLLEVFTEEFDAAKPELTPGDENIVRYGLCNVDGVFGVLLGFVGVLFSDAYLRSAEEEFDSEISESSGEVRR